MCGRYQFTAEQCEEIRQIADAIQRKYGKESWAPGEIRPANYAPVLVAASDSPVPQLMKWGYQLPNTLVINARAETAAEKPLFRESIGTRRCLIPSTGFYEWDISKRKYLFTLPEEPVLYMAGLYDRRGSEDCYCILTTAPNASMRPIHDRMPLVIPPRKMQDWLIDGTAALSMLSMQPPELMRQSMETQISLW
jgi:putative SOS response-associated peptidase YedK